MIQFENVCKTYKGGQLVLDHLNFTLPVGQITVLVGPSGCGKTTALKLINRLIAPTSGKILIDGVDIATLDPVSLRRAQGYVVQSIGLFPHLSIEENIELIPKLQKQNESEIKAHTAQLMQMIGLDPTQYLHRYPSALSGGQQQRIGVARAFATDPKLILMDEPFSALDPISRGSLQDELLNLQQQFHKTIVFVTHDMDEAIKIADNICLMQGGKILQFDSPENILKHPADDFVKTFVGGDRIYQNPEFIRAKDIFIKDPVTSSGNTKLIKAAEIMRRSRVDSLLIVDDTHHLLGIVSIANLHKGLHTDTPLKEFMRTQFSTVSPEDNMIAILNRFEEGANILPVVDEKGILQGLITRSCLVGVMSRQFISEED